MPDIRINEKAAILARKTREQYYTYMGKIVNDVKRRGILLTLLVLLQTYAIIAFAPSGLYQLLHNPEEFTINQNMLFITLEYIFAATFLMTTLFLLLGIMFWNKKMAIFFLVFSFVIVFFEFFLHRQSVGSAPTLVLPLVWLYAIIKKWSYFH